MCIGVAVNLCLRNFLREISTCRYIDHREIHRRGDARLHFNLHVQFCTSEYHRQLCYKRMGNTPAKVEAKPEGEKKLKPCCACPETKKVRDECIVTKGEENCGHLIEAHKACMRYMGFNI